MANFCSHFIFMLTVLIMTFVTIVYHFHYKDHFPKRILGTVHLSKKLANLSAEKQTMTQQHQKGCTKMEKDFVIHKLKTELLHCPNYKIPYNLTNPAERDFSQFKEGQSLMERYFPEKRNGFFIEAGAYEGEYLSNTLQIERERNWTGILVEPLADNFEKLRKKQRKAYLFNGCLDNVCGFVNRTVEGSAWAGKISKGNGGNKVICVSISDILEALSVFHVDWMVLDVEGYEVPILMSFPWTSVTVDLIQLEILEGGIRKHANIVFFKMFLETIGFHEEPVTRLDMVFRRKAAGLKTYSIND